MWHDDNDDLAHRFVTGDRETVDIHIQTHTAYKWEIQDIRVGHTETPETYDGYRADNYPRSTTGRAVYSDYTVGCDSVSATYETSVCAEFNYQETHYDWQGLFSALFTVGGVKGNPAIDGTGVAVAQGVSQRNRDIGHNPCEHDQLYPGSSTAKRCY